MYSNMHSLLPCRHRQDQRDMWLFEHGKRHKYLRKRQTLQIKHAQTVKTNSCKRFPKAQDYFEFSLYPSMKPVVKSVLSKIQDVKSLRCMLRDDFSFCTHNRKLPFKGIHVYLV